MFTPSPSRLFAPLSRLFGRPALVPNPGLAQHLMERAEASAGQDPAHAQELRLAASAFLSVVR